MERVCDEADQWHLRINWGQLDELEPEGMEETKRNGK